MASEIHSSRTNPSEVRQTDSTASQHKNNPKFGDQPQATPAEQRQAVQQERVRIDKTGGDQLTALGLASTAIVDLKQLLADAVAVHNAADADYRLFRWADKDGINKILENKSDAERNAIGDLYKGKYGISLDDEIGKFETGSDLDTFENIFHRHDADSISQAAGRIHEDLLEYSNWGGRSESKIEQDIRNTLAYETPDQVALIDTAYRNHYKISLGSDLALAPLSKKTESAASLYLEPLRNDQTTAKLIDVAVQAKDLNMFEEAMRDASPQARETFRRNGGDVIINTTFGPSTLTKIALGVLGPVAQAFGHALDTKAIDGALDYARTGQLSTQSQITQNTGWVFSNPEAITLALKRMTNGERQMYLEGKSLHEGVSLPQISAQDQLKAKDYYESLHAAISRVSNRTTMVVREDMIAHDGESSWVGTLAKHRGLLWNDSISEVTKDLDAMTNDQWLDCKTHPERRVAFIDMLQSLDSNKTETEKVLQQYDKKMSAKTYAESTPSKDLVDRLNDMRRGWNGVDFAVDTDEAVRTVEKAFDQDRKLRDRIVNPQTVEDKQYSNSFKNALQSAIGGDYELFGKRLAESGQLPLEFRLGLDQGILGLDEKKAYTDIAHATESERQRLKNDPAYRAQILGQLSTSRQQIGSAVAAQGKIEPEDLLRSDIVGWGGSSDIIEKLSAIDQMQLNNVSQRYTEKYGTSFEGDLMAKLTGHDRTQAEQILTENLNLDERVNIAKTETESTRSGAGAWIADNIFASGTGPQADDAANRTIKSLEDAHQLDHLIETGTARLKNFSPEELNSIKQKICSQIEQCISAQNQAMENQFASKSAAANYVSDAGITVAAVASMMLTEGADTPLVISLAVAGAGIKIGTNAVLEGNDYDTSIKNLSKDGIVGGVTGALSVIGSEQVASVFGIGESAAKEGASLTLQAVEQAGMSDVIKEGGEEALENGAKSIMQSALASGAKKLDQAAFTELAEQVVEPGLESEAREKAVTLIATQLKETLTERMATGVVRWATAQALNAAGGATAGAVGGATEASLDWDSSRTVSQNLSRIADAIEEGAVTGAAAGSATHIVFSGTRGIVQSVRDGIHGRGGIKFTGVDDSPL